MTLFVSLIAIFALMVLSAFFSGSETALTAASKARLHQLEEEGDTAAKKTNKLLKNKARLISSILLGNNLVNILASAIATSFMIRVYGEAGVVYATLIMTLLIYVFCEVLPKSYSIHNPLPIALKFTTPIKFFVYLFSPIAKTIDVFLNGFSKVFRINLSPQLTTDEHEEELRGAIALHQGTDPEIKHERKMLKSILDLDDVEVSEIMQHRTDVVMIDLTKPTAEIIEDVMESPFSRIPLIKGKRDDIIGILHAKDLLREIYKSPDQIDKIDMAKLSSKPWFIPESTSLLSQLQAFQKRHEHFAVVVDEYGSFMGIVTLEDILEEIVGDIADEHDQNLLPGIRPQPDGSFILDGTMTLRELNRELSWSLPDEEAATIAGLILHESRQIPEPGQIFKYYNFTFEILRKENNQITLVKVIPCEKKEDEED